MLAAAVDQLGLPTCERNQGPAGSRIVRHRRGEIRRESTYELVIIYVAEQDYGFGDSCWDAFFVKARRPKSAKVWAIGNVHMRAGDEKICWGRRLLECLKGCLG
jgi:hypothetical protein